MSEIPKSLEHCSESTKSMFAPGKNLLQMLCAKGKHKLIYSTSGMACYCDREGCDYYWEYD